MRKYLVAALEHARELHDGGDAALRVVGVWGDAARTGQHVVAVRRADGRKLKLATPSGRHVFVDKHCV